MKANFFQKYWTLTVVVLSTLNTCIKAIVLSAFKQLTRERTTRYLDSWSASLLRAAGVQYQVIQPEGFRFEPGKPYIIMSNHASHYDIPIIFQVFDQTIRMLGKIELFRIPIFGRALTAAEFVSIDRKNREKAIGDLKRARRLMESGVVLWVAPEGTRSKDGRLQAFKQGGFHLAINTGATIVPVGIRGANAILPSKTTDLMLNQNVEVHIGQPIDASQYRADQRQELVDRVRREMLKLCG